MTSPVKPTLNGSIPIGLTGVTKLCLSSVSFRRSTGVYKSDSIGSTGERNTVLTCQSTGVSSNQPASSISISSVQPAFRWISAGVSGELNRRNQPTFKPYASDRPALRKKRGAHLSYLSLARVLCLFLCSPFTPPPDSNRHAAIAVPRRRALARPRSRPRSPARRQPSRRRRASTAAHPAPLTCVACARLSTACAA